MKRRRLIAHLGGAALAQLTALRLHADAPEACGLPIARDDGWPVVSINEQGLLGRGALCGMTDRLAAATDPGVHAVVVARGGKPVFEQYFERQGEVPGGRLQPAGVPGTVRRFQGLAAGDVTCALN